MSTVLGAAILAHQGGWDEMLMVLGPIALMAGLLRLAKKRVDARRAADAGSAPPTSVNDGSPERTS